jgi:hypothetical protein
MRYAHLARPSSVFAAALLVLLAVGRTRAGETAPCPDCRGSGKLQNRCEKCQGAGKLECAFCKGKQRGRSNADRSTGVISCTDCAGKGFLIGAAGGQVKCARCRGAGAFQCPKCHDGQCQCEACGGTGKTSTPCPRCAGTGRIRVAGDPEILKLEAERADLRLRIAQLTKEIETLKKRLGELDSKMGTLVPAERIPPKQGDPKLPPRKEDDF